MFLLLNYRELSNNLLDITRSQDMLNLLGDRSVIRIENNLPMPCDSAVLAWYPETSNIISDREQIICANVNMYGELELNPHVLRLDEQAPGTHASINGRVGKSVKSRYFFSSGGFSLNLLRKKMSQI